MKTKHQKKNMNTTTKWRQGGVVLLLSGFVALFPASAQAQEGPAKSIETAKAAMSGQPKYGESKQYPAASGAWWRHCSPCYLTKTGGYIAKI